MKILVVGKVPPIQGGVAVRTLEFCLEAANAGHEVVVVSNALETEPEFQCEFSDSDRDYYSKLCGENLRILWIEGRESLFHVPNGDLYGQRLFGACRETLRTFDADVIVGWYLQPYGFTAILVGESAGKPVVLLTAGSDIGRLSNHKNLRECHAWMFGRASLSVVGPSALETVQALFPDVPRTRFACARSRLVSDLTTRPSQLPFSIRTLAERLSRRDATFLPTPPQHEPCEDVATISVYGKAGESKGTYLLIETLAEIAQEGLDFNFVAALSGTKARLRRVYSMVKSAPELSARTWLLPAIPPWQISSLCESSSVVCFLENCFPIPFHRPSVPFEVLVNKSCLLCTSGILHANPFLRHLVHSESCLVADEPLTLESLKQNLKRVILNPSEAKTIAARGAALTRCLAREAQEESNLLSLVTSVANS